MNENVFLRQYTFVHLNIGGGGGGRGDDEERVVPLGVENK